MSMIVLYEVCCGNCRRAYRVFQPLLRCIYHHCQRGHRGLALGSMTQRSQCLQQTRLVNLCTTAGRLSALPAKPSFLTTYRPLQVRYFSSQCPLGQLRFHAGAGGSEPPISWLGPPNLAILLTHCGQVILGKN